MKATLIFPPATDPRAPQLALPSLAAALRADGVETRLLDLNLAGLTAVLAPERLRRAGRRVATSAAADDRLRLLARRAGPLAGAVGEALATLRDPERFFDANDYNAARETILSALDLVSAAAPGVSYSIAPIRYDVRGCNPQVLADLVRVTADRAANVFADHWEDEVFPALDRDGPDLVGISITNRQQLLPGLMLARGLRARGHFVVIGGAVFTKFVDALARRPDFFRTFADGVVVYEGETALLELLRQLDGPGRLDEVPNYLYREGDAVRVTPTHLENVEALPTPDFEGLPLGEYLAPAPVLPILTGKGCYFNRCKFCDIPYINHISPKAYRVRSPARIVADVQALARRTGARHFVITDEALSPRLLGELADAFAAHPGAPRHFTGYARLESGFTPEVCAKLAGMGMRKVFFGLESAAQRTLDHMDKGTRVAEAPLILKNFRDAGIGFHLFSIVGFPEEDEASARETFRFFADHRETIDHPANSFDIHPFGLELRTRYFEEAGALGVRIRPGALAKDFVIGVGERDWENARGLTAARVAELIAGEFYPALREIYRHYHNCPLHLWPAFEEYAVLYGAHYRDRPFSARTCLPSAEDGPFRLRWNPATLVERHGDTVRLAGRHGREEVPATLHGFLADGRPRTLAALLAEGGGDPATVRAFVEALCAAGLLQVDLS